MAYVVPTGWVDGSSGGTPITAAALNLRDANVADHQTRITTLESGKQPLATLLTRLVAPPVTVTYAASITLDASLGCVFRVTATGNLVVADITGGVDGQAVHLEVLASGTTRNVTVTGADPSSVAAGQWWTGSFRYNAGTNTWLFF